MSKKFSNVNLNAPKAPAKRATIFDTVVTSAKTTTTAAPARSLGRAGGLTGLSSLAPAAPKNTKKRGLLDSLAEEAKGTKILEEEKTRADTDGDAEAENEEEQQKEQKRKGPSWADQSENVEDEPLGTLLGSKPAAWTAPAQAKSMQQIMEEEKAEADRKAAAKAEFEKNPWGGPGNYPADSAWNNSDARFERYYNEYRSNNGVGEGYHGRGGHAGAGDGSFYPGNSHDHSFYGKGGQSGYYGGGGKGNGSGYYGAGPGAYNAPADPSDNDLDWRRGAEAGRGGGEQHAKTNERYSSQRYEEEFHARSQEKIMKIKFTADPVDRASLFGTAKQVSPTKEKGADKGADKESKGDKADKDSATKDSSAGYVGGKDQHSSSGGGKDKDHKSSSEHQQAGSSYHHHGNNKDTNSALNSSFQSSKGGDRSDHGTSYSKDSYHKSTESNKGGDRIKANHDKHSSQQQQDKDNYASSQQEIKKNNYASSQYDREEKNYNRGGGGNKGGDTRADRDNMDNKSAGRGLGGSTKGGSYDDLHGSKGTSGSVEQQYGGGKDHSYNKDSLSQHSSYNTKEHANASGGGGYNQLHSSSSHSKDQHGKDSSHQQHGKDHGREPYGSLAVSGGKDHQQHAKDHGKDQHGKEQHRDNYGNSAATPAAAGGTSRFASFGNTSQQERVNISTSAATTTNINLNVMNVVQQSGGGSSRFAAQPTAANSKDRSYASEQQRGDQSAPQLGGNNMIKNLRGGAGAGQNSRALERRDSGTPVYGSHASMRDNRGGDQNWSKHDMLPAHGGSSYKVDQSQGYYVGNQTKGAIYNSPNTSRGMNTTAMLDSGGPGGSDTNLPSPGSDHLDSQSTKRGHGHSAMDDHGRRPPYSAPPPPPVGPPPSQVPTAALVTNVRETLRQCGHMSLQKLAAKFPGTNETFFAQHASVFCLDRQSRVVTLLEESMYMPNREPNIYRSFGGNAGGAATQTDSVYAQFNSEGGRPAEEERHEGSERKRKNNKHEVGDHSSKHATATSNNSTTATSAGAYKPPARGVDLNKSTVKQDDQFVDPDNSWVDEDWAAEQNDLYGSEYDAGLGIQGPGQGRGGDDRKMDRDYSDRKMDYNATGSTTATTTKTLSNSAKKAYKDDLTTSSSKKNKNKDHGALQDAGDEEHVEYTEEEWAAWIAEQKAQKRAKRESRMLAKQAEQGTAGQSRDQIIGTANQKNSTTSAGQAGSLSTRGGGRHNVNGPNNNIMGGGAADQSSEAPVNKNLVALSANGGAGNSFAAKSKTGVKKAVNLNSLDDFKSSSTSRGGGNKQRGGNNQNQNQNQPAGGDQNASGGSSSGEGGQQKPKWQGWGKPDPDTPIQKESRPLTGGEHQHQQQQQGSSMNNTQSQQQQGSSGNNNPNSMMNNANPPSASFQHQGQGRNNNKGRGKKGGNNNSAGAAGGGPHDPRRANGASSAGSPGADTENSASAVEGQANGAKGGSKRGGNNNKGQGKRGGKGRNRDGGGGQKGAQDGSNSTTGNGAQEQGGEHLQNQMKNRNQHLQKTPGNQQDHVQNGPPGGKENGGNASGNTTRNQGAGRGIGNRNDGGANRVEERNNKPNIKGDKDNKMKGQDRGDNNKGGDGQHQRSNNKGEGKRSRPKGDGSKGGEGGKRQGPAKGEATGKK
ncbi:unnamed protein product [Amoebophrya sp. A25]|nr:unnamed protein product [Amoebophrya sp. A25]|eukprot:GSA25T00019335001.1